MDPTLGDHYLTSVQTIGKENFDSLCLMMKNKVVHRTAGLVECMEKKHTGNWADRRDEILSSNHGSADTRKLEVRFIHRTVDDFLRDSEEGHKFLTASSSTSEEIIDRAFLRSFPACLVECVQPFNIDVLIDMAEDDAWISQKDYLTLEYIEDVCQRLSTSLLRTSEAHPPGDFVFNLKCDDDEELDYTEAVDYAGLTAPISAACTAFLLSRRGTCWSPYYMGYLFVCCVQRILNSAILTLEQVREVINTFKILRQAGADLASCHPCHRAVRYLGILSPASSLLVLLLLKYDADSGVYLASEVMRMLSDVNVGDQTFSLARDLDKNSAWNICLRDTTYDVLVTFRCSNVLRAMQSALAACGASKPHIR